MSDFRSDTVTLPTPAMKQAMMEAPLGDDVLGEDPTVNLLHEPLPQCSASRRHCSHPRGLKSQVSRSKI